MLGHVEPVADHEVGWDRESEIADVAGLGAVAHEQGADFQTGRTGLSTGTSRISILCRPLPLCLKLTGRSEL